MLDNLQKLSLAQRRYVFFLIFGGGIFLIIAVTALLISAALNQRDVPESLSPSVTVREFAVLPDEDAYPPAAAVLADGTVITGSFASGAVWSITTDGTVTEIPGTRDAIGAFTGIAALPDGSVLIIDQEDTDPRSEAGVLWRLQGQTLSEFTVQGLDERGWVSPNDATVDAQGRIYLSDSGRNEVWRFNLDGSNGAVWWVPPVNADDPRHAVTGLAYDAINDALIVTDPEVNRIYRVALANGDTTVIYDHGTRQYPPGFDGVDVAPDGTIYVAALGQKGIARLEDNDLDYIAGLFRNPSDVVYAMVDGAARLYVPNFDQSSLVLPFDVPQLPFSVDVIEFTGM